MTARRMNYKAKWLASLEGRASAPGEVATVLEQKLETVDNTQFSAVRELASLHTALQECGATAVDLCEMMDASRDVGQVTFKEVVHGIDTKLSTMPSKVLARRVRDVLRIADERIGILTSICESNFEAITRMSHRADVLEIGNRKLQYSVLNSLVIGKNPTPNEMEDYSMDPSSIKRLSEYSELPDDFTAMLTNNRKTALDYGNNTITDADYDDIFDDGDDTPEITAVVKQKHKHKRGDSKYQQDIPL